MLSLDILTPLSRIQVLNNRDTNRVLNRTKQKAEKGAKQDRTAK